MTVLPDPTMEGTGDVTGGGDPTTGQEESTPAPADPAPSETALLTEFQEMVKAPQFLMGAFRQMSSDRAYVSKDCMLLDTQDAVAVNHILRNQRQSLAYLGVSDPQPFCQPARQVGGVVSQFADVFAETMEIHLSRQLPFMDFARKIEGAAQDASTNGYAVLKVTLQTDPTKDPLGRERFGDMQTQVLALEELRRRKATGDVQPGTADYQRLIDLERTVRIFLAGKIEEQIKAVPVMVPGMVPAVDPVSGAPVIDPFTAQPVMVPGMVADPTDPREIRRQAIVNGETVDILGCPELEQFIGFACDQIQPDDFRWDWSLTRPEDWPVCAWMAHRVYMEAEEIATKFQLTPTELAAIRQGTGANQRSYGTTNSTDQDPSNRLDIETTTLNTRVAVWDLYHRRLGRRFVFAEGINRFLVNEVPQALGRRWFPFFFIYYNRTTGQVIPVSDVQLVRHLQDEYNTLRSHDREGRRASFPVAFVQKGTLSPPAQALYRNRAPFAIIETENADDIKKQLSESVTMPYNPALFSTSSVERDMQAMFGLPATVVGGGDGGMDLASQLALAKEGMETGVSARRIAINRTITDIFQWMAEVSLKVFPESYVKRTCGAGAVWPRLTSEELYTNLRIEVKGGISGQPRAKDRIDLWMNFAQVAQQLQLPINGVEVLRELLDALGIRVDFTRFILPPGMAPMAPVASVPPGVPAAQGPRGADGGAPPMVERGAPSSMEQIPNHPPIPEGAPPPPPGFQ